MRCGHTVHCCLQLCTTVYNYSTLFTVLGLTSAVMFLCRTYDVYVCVDFVNFSRHAILGIFTPSQCCVIGDLRTIFCMQKVGTVTSVYCSRRTCLYPRQTTFSTGPRKCSEFSLTPRLLELPVFLPDCEFDIYKYSLNVLLGRPQKFTLPVANCPVWVVLH
jgi:hypothetical protein